MRAPRKRLVGARGRGGGAIRSHPCQRAGAIQLQPPCWRLMFHYFDSRRCRMDRRWFVVLAVVALFGIMVAPTVAKAADLTGTVKSADAAKNSCVVTGADGKDTTVTWDDKTEVTVDGKKGT